MVILYFVVKATGFEQLVVVYLVAMMLLISVAQFRWVARNLRKIAATGPVPPEGAPHA